MSVGGGFINQRMSQEDRKKEIRQAAMKVFLDKGFRNTVMNDIMEATGLSLSLIHISEPTRPY